MRGEEDRLVTLSEGATISGYSRGYLGRLVRTGVLANLGRPNAPRVRLGDLPHKPGALPSSDRAPHLSDASKGPIVRSVAGLEEET